MVSFCRHLGHKRSLVELVVVEVILEEAMPLRIARFNAAKDDDNAEFLRQFDLELAKSVLEPLGSFLKFFEICKFCTIKVCELNYELPYCIF